MASVNKVIIVGFLGRDPEKRFLQNGTPVTNIAVATTESWKTDGGEKKEKTEWHQVVLFGRLAENAGDWLRKGSQVFIEGRLNSEKYTDRDGVERRSTRIIAVSMQSLDRKNDSQQSSVQVKSDYVSAKYKTYNTSSAPRNTHEEDEIPF